MPAYAPQGRRAEANLGHQHLKLQRRGGRRSAAGARRLGSARFLAGRDIVKVISSPLERAQQTAAPLAKAYGLEVEIDPRIIESMGAERDYCAEWAAGDLCLR